jgi:uroporphyrin-III C-methyltransferase
MNPPAAALAALLGRMPDFPPGHVWLTGAGPGDPGHLTLHAIAGLVQADVIVHDALVDPAVLDLTRKEARIVFAGKRGGKPSAQQADITAHLIALARAGERVLRLKGGDPFVFGRGGEEALALAEAGIPFRVIPGITAGLAGLASAGIPATMRGVNQAIVLATGHGAAPEDTPDWHRLARLGQPLVLYMAVSSLPRIAAALIEGGLPPDTPAAVIGQATRPQQEVVTSTLAQVAEAAAHVRAPAIVTIGAIVPLRERLLGRAP